MALHPAVARARVDARLTEITPHETRLTCSCTGQSGEPKRKYVSRTSAVSTAIAHGWAARAYRCPTTPKWHLTH